ncbi:MAG: ABC transporter ATP-binding protein [Candidatus Hodarchaeales archaeon]|jgi:ABC-type multidrug transport system fused ATPase/permease subunit
MSHGGGGGGGPMRMGGAFMADKTRTKPTKVLLGKLWNYLREAKYQLITVSVIIFLFAIINTIAPIVISEAIDTFDQISSEVIYLLIFGFIGLSILMWIFESISLWISAGIKSNLVNDIRRDTFNHLVDSDMKYHHTQQSGNITSRVIGDTEEVATGITIFTDLSSQLLLIGTTFILLLLINPIFAAIALLAVPAAFIITKVISGVGRRRMLKARQAMGHVSGKLAESLSGVAISKSFNREKETSKEINALNEQFYVNMLKIGMIFTMVMPSISMISTILVSLILITGGIIGINSITIGSIFLGTVMVQRFLAPFIHLGMFTTQLQASLAALDRLVDIQEAVPSVTNSQDANPLNLANPSITFDNVSFNYVENEYVLKHINFSITAGEKIALVGHTGAGKTTISSLLMRFYDPAYGLIKIGNQDLKDVTLESLHQSVSLVPQEPYLFADSVLENIRYGDPNASDEDIFTLCKLIGADQFIDALPQGYDTILQESGKSLSAGQRQMITIARTMLSDPKILILDEATSRLDAYSESLVQKAQNLLFEGRTTIVIAHRLSTIQDVDRIFVLENGQLIEQGTNEELLEAKGKYYELYKTYYAHQGVSEIEEPLLEEMPIQENKVDMVKMEKMKEMHMKMKKGSFPH